MEATRNQEERRSTLRLPADLARALRIEAAKRDTKINPLIVDVLRKWLRSRKD